MIDTELLGMHKDHPIHLNFGKFGYYLRYDGKNYSLPAWASPNLSLYQAVKIVDYKMTLSQKRASEQLENAEASSCRSTKQLEIKIPEYKPKIKFHDDSD
jgi:topoisomerase IA-like protein